MVPVVTMAMHTTEGTGHSPLSSLAHHSHPYSLVPRTVALENLQSEPQKTLPVQPPVSAHDGNMALASGSIPMMAGCHNPSSMAVPSTGMDVQYGPSDLTAHVGNNSMQQQEQDVYYTPAPPKVEGGYTGFTLMSVRLSVRPCRQGFRNFLKKPLAQFISYLAFTLMG